MGCRWCTFCSVVVQFLAWDTSHEMNCQVRNVWLLFRFDGSETLGSFLGFGLHDLCKTLSCLYPPSQLEEATQTFSSLSGMFASALVVLRV